MKLVLLFVLFVFDFLLSRPSSPFTIPRGQNQPQGKKKKQKKAAALPWDCGLGILFLDETTVNSDRDISDEEDEEEDSGEGR